MLALSSPPNNLPRNSVASIFAVFPSYRGVGTLRFFCNLMGIVALRVMPQDAKEKDSEMEIRYEM